MSVMKLIRLPAVLLFSAIAINAQAALIDNGFYVTDTVSGLDWLKLTETVNRSYNDVSSQLGVGGEFAGWQYASGVQFDGLLLGQGVVADVGCADGASYCGGAYAANSAVIDGLVNLIGDTFEYASRGGSVSSDAKAALGLLSDSDFNGGAHHIGLLVGSYLADTPYARTHYGDPVSNDLTATHVGSFLVRTSEVPLPAGGYLFMSTIVGLMGLFGRLRLPKVN